MYIYVLLDVVTRHCLSCLEQGVVSSRIIIWLLLGGFAVIQFILGIAINTHFKMDFPVDGAHTDDIIMLTRQRDGVKKSEDDDCVSKTIYV